MAADDSAAADAASLRASRLAFAPWTCASEFWALWLEDELKLVSTSPRYVIALAKASACVQPSQAVIEAVISVLQQVWAAHGTTFLDSLLDMCDCAFDAMGLSPAPEAALPLWNAYLHWLQSRCDDAFAAWSQARSAYDECVRDDADDKDDMDEDAASAGGESLALELAEAHLSSCARTLSAAYARRLRCCLPGERAVLEQFVVWQGAVEGSPAASTVAAVQAMQADMRVSVSVRELVHTHMDRIAAAQDAPALEAAWRACLDDVASHIAGSKHKDRTAIAAHVRLSLLRRVCERATVSVSADTEGVARAKQLESFWDDLALHCATQWTPSYTGMCVSWAAAAAACTRPVVWQALIGHAEKVLAAGDAGDALRAAAIAGAVSLVREWIDGSGNVTGGVHDAATPAATGSAAQVDMCRHVVSAATQVHSRAGDADAHALQQVLQACCGAMWRAMSCAQAEADLASEVQLRALAQDWMASCHATLRAASTTSSQPLLIFDMACADAAHHVLRDDALSGAWWDRLLVYAGSSAAHSGALAEWEAALLPSGEPDWQARTRVVQRVRITNVDELCGAYGAAISAAGALTGSNERVRQLYQHAVNRLTASTHDAGIKRAAFVAAQRLLQSWLRWETSHAGAAEFLDVYMRIRDKSEWVQKRVDADAPRATDGAAAAPPTIDVPAPAKGTKRPRPATQKQEAAVSTAPPSAACIPDVSVEALSSTASLLAALQGRAPVSSTAPAPASATSYAAASATDAPTRGDAPADALADAPAVDEAGSAVQEALAAVAPRKRARLAMEAASARGQPRQSAEGASAAATGPADGDSTTVAAADAPPAAAAERTVEEASARTDDAAACSVLMFNMPYGGVSLMDLMRQLSGCGAIVEAKLLYNLSRQFKGMAIVRFAERESVRAAFKLKGQLVAGGRTVFIGIPKLPGARTTGDAPGSGAAPRAHTNAEDATTGAAATAPAVAPTLPATPASDQVNYVTAAPLGVTHAQASTVTSSAAASESAHTEAASGPAPAQGNAKPRVVGIRPRAVLVKR